MGASSQVAPETTQLTPQTETPFEQTMGGILAELLDRRRDLTPRKLATKILKKLKQQANVEITGKMVEDWTTGADYPTPDILDALITVLIAKAENEIKKYRHAYNALQEWMELPLKNRTGERPQEFALQTLLYVVESAKSFEDLAADITEEYILIPTEARIDIDYRLVSRMLANQQSISKPLTALTIRTLRDMPVMERENFASRELMLRRFYLAATECRNGKSLTENPTPPIPLTNGHVVTAGI